MKIKERVLEKLAQEYKCGASQMPVTRRAIDIVLEEVKKEIWETEEGLEGTAVEFCEKHGEGSYTGFKECLKEVKRRIA